MTELPLRFKIWISSLTYIGALANEAGGWLVRFVHPGFAYFKIGSFLLLEISLAVLVIVIGISLLMARHRARLKQRNQSWQGQETPEQFVNERDF